MSNSEEDFVNGMDEYLQRNREKYEQIKAMGFIPKSNEYKTEQVPCKSCGKERRLIIVKSEWTCHLCDNYDNIYNDDDLIPPLITESSVDINTIKTLENRIEILEKDINYLFMVLENKGIL
jgi:ssDNA-binding Zn-finger/Zn-ribbon topoisomerase 1